MNINLPLILGQVDDFQSRMGYKRARFELIEINRDGEICAKFYCEDEFQGTYDNESTQVGAIRVPITEHGVLDCVPLLNREQRELTYLAKRLGKTLEMSKALQSAAGKRFADDLIRSAYELKNLLPYQQANALGQTLREIEPEGDWVVPEDI